MSEIIEKTYKLLDVLDNSEVIQKLTQYKEKIQQDEEVLSLVKKINNEDNPEIKVELKKKLYSNISYKNYIDAYNELFYIVLKINKKYAEYTNTKENNCHN
jgi:cell fate (sporulation/competence/biofilm development) regulator YlbF (YheA/YmcA/DUF963 family)